MRIDLHVFKRLAVLPGLHPQGQPLAHGGGCGERAAAKRGTAGVPALAHRVVVMQVAQRRRHAVVGMVPADLNPHRVQVLRAGRSGSLHTHFSTQRACGRAGCAAQPKRGLGQGAGEGAELERGLDHGLLRLEKGPGHPDKPSV